VYDFKFSSFVFRILCVNELVEMSCNVPYNCTCVNDVECVSTLVIYHVDLCYV
jgi:hypothetical protein